MHIYIPSTQRADKQLTLMNLPSMLRRAKTSTGITVVVPAKQACQYREALTHAPNVLITETPSKIKGIGPTRQWILETARAAKQSHIVMMDDDLRFAKRRKDDPTKFEDASDADVQQMLATIEISLAPVTPHVGVCTREGGNRMLDDAYNTRMLRILAYHVPTYFKHGIRYDRTELMEDFDVTLQLLRKGLSNLVLHSWVHDQVMSNAPGGCSTYRTLEKQRAAAYKLAELHPGFVKTVEKQTKTAWNGMARTDVVVAWKKAFASAGGM